MRCSEFRFGIGIATPGRVCEIPMQFIGITIGAPPACPAVAFSAQADARPEGPAVAELGWLAHFTTMATMDVYGFAHEDLPAARRAIEGALSICLEEAEESD